MDGKERKNIRMNGKERNKNNGYMDGNEKERKDEWVNAWIRKDGWMGKKEKERMVGKVRKRIDGWMGKE